LLLLYKKLKFYMSNCSLKTKIYCPTASRVVVYDPCPSSPETTPSGSTSATPPEASPHKPVPNVWVKRAKKAADDAARAKKAADDEQTMKQAADDEQTMKQAAAADDEHADHEHAAAAADDEHADDEHGMDRCDVQKAILGYIVYGSIRDEAMAITNDPDAVRRASPVVRAVLCTWRIHHSQDSVRAAMLAILNGTRGGRLFGEDLHGYLGRTYGDESIVNISAEVQDVLDKLEKLDVRIGYLTVSHYVEEACCFRNKIEAELVRHPDMRERNLDLPDICVQHLVDELRRVIEAGYAREDVLIAGLVRNRANVVLAVWICIDDVQGVLEKWAHKYKVEDSASQSVIDNVQVVIDKTVASMVARKARGEL
jgi:hypothetical protein